MAHVCQKLRLVLARLCELAALVLNFLKQPHVLNCDYRLVRESGSEFDLLRRERLHRLPHQNHHAQRNPFADERNAQHRAKARTFLSLKKSVIWIGKDILNLDRVPLLYGATENASFGRFDGQVLREKSTVILWKALRGDFLITLSLLLLDSRHIRFAKPDRGLHQGVENGLKIEGRAADYLEHVGGCGLLLERFREIARALAQLVEQARVLDGDDGLCGEVLYQLDL